MKTNLKQLNVLFNQHLFPLFFLIAGFSSNVVAQQQCGWVDGLEGGIINLPVSCMGTNVTENFNSDNGGFTSDDFVWNASQGYWEAIIDRPISRSEPDTYVITSGVYTIDEGGYVNYGFIWKGPSKMSIEIVDASSGETLAGCESAGYTFYPDQRGYFITCLRFPYPETETDEHLAEGREIQFVTTFYVDNRSFIRGRNIIYDNFSVAGSATAVDDATTLLRNTNSQNILPKESLSKVKAGFPDFTLFPNPVSQQTTLSVGKQLSGNTILSISRADGLLLRTYELRKGEDSALLDFTNEKPGLYIITLQDENGKRTIRKLFKCD